MRLEEIVFVSPLGLRYLCLPKYISMKFTEQKLKGVFVIEPQVFGDSRGYFMESYKKELFEKYIGVVDFIQDNESRSSYGVVRGLHFQRGEWSQSKLVRVTQGRVYDIPMHRHYLNQQESVVFARLLKISFENMSLYSFSRQDRVSVINRMLEYYRLHVPDFPEIKSLSVMQSLFD